MAKERFLLCSLGNIKHFVLGCFFLCTLVLTTQSKDCCFGFHCDGMANCDKLINKCVCNVTDADNQTCLPKVGGCSITEGFVKYNHSVATCHNITGNCSSTSYAIFSCTDIGNLAYDIHVLASRYGSKIQSVEIIRNGSGNTKPIILVLASYESRQWKIEIDPDVIIDTVILISQNRSELINRSNHHNFTVKHYNGNHEYGIGAYGGNFKTVKLLKFLYRTYGTIRSFTGSYHSIWKLFIGDGMSRTSSSVQPSVSTNVPKHSLVCPTVPTFNPSIIFAIGAMEFRAIGMSKFEARGSLSIASHNIIFTTPRITPECGINTVIEVSSSAQTKPLSFSRSLTTRSIKTGRYSTFTKQSNEISSTTKKVSSTSKTVVVYPSIPQGPTMTSHPADTTTLKLERKTVGLTTLSQYVASATREVSPTSSTIGIANTSAAATRPLSSSLILMTTRSLTKEMKSVSSSTSSQGLESATTKDVSPLSSGPIVDIFPSTTTGSMSSSPIVATTTSLKKEKSKIVDSATSSQDIGPTTIKAIPKSSGLIVDIFPSIATRSISSLPILTTATSSPDIGSTTKKANPVSSDLIVDISSSIATKSISSLPILTTATSSLDIGSTTKKANPVSSDLILDISPSVATKSISSLPILTTATSGLDIGSTTKKANPVSSDLIVDIFPSISTTSVSSLPILTTATSIPDIVDIVDISPSITTRLMSSSSVLVTTTSLKKESDQPVSPTLSTLGVSSSVPSSPIPKMNKTAKSDKLVEYSNHPSIITTAQEKCVEEPFPGLGFKFHGVRLSEMFICPNGLIRFRDNQFQHWPRILDSVKSHEKDYIFAPYWSRVDLSAFQTNESKVRFKSYHKDINPSPQVFNRVNNAVKNFTSQATFNATWVSVVTWENLKPFNSKDFEGRNLFQVVFLSDETSWFVLYIYADIEWSVPASSEEYSRWKHAAGLPVMGWNTRIRRGFKYNDGEQYQNLPFSGTINAENIDNVTGNLGLGCWIFNVSRKEAKSADLLCYEWFQNTVTVFQRRRLQCPPTYFIARSDNRFAQHNHQGQFCFANVIPVFGFAVRCCYDRLFLNLLTTIPSPGSLLLRNPLYFQTADGDDYGYKKCCVDSNLCLAYFLRRPKQDGSFYRLPRRSWSFGDPHYQNMDRLNLTFNGCGEFMFLDGNNTQFQIQARFTQASGAGFGTVTSAIVIKPEGSDAIQVNLKKNGGFLFLVNGSTYPGYNNFSTLPTIIQEGISVRKTSQSKLVITTADEHSVEVIQQGVNLVVIVALHESLFGKTRGLLGNWSGRTDDDFLLPNGTILPPTITARQIHFEFGEKWRLTPEQSLFVNTTADKDFQCPEDYQPILMTNITFPNSTLEAAARDVCGEDTNCLFDIAATHSIEFGQNTLNSSNTIQKDEEIIGNNAPTFTVENAVLNFTLGERFEYTVTASDIDGDPIKLSVNGLPVGATIATIGNNLTVTWLVNSTEQVKLSFIVIDDKNASKALVPVINVCACQNNGICYKKSANSQQTALTFNSFNILDCHCPVGFTDQFCETTKDFCESGSGSPCHPLVECTNSATGYICGPCPTGYEGGGNNCSDINECNKGTHDCEMKCINSAGSFQCQCNSSYQLNPDNKRCDDINECNEQPNPCNTTGGEECINLRGGFKCECNNSLGLIRINGTCQDINECNEQPNPCNTTGGEECINLRGGFKCECNNSLGLIRINGTCQGEPASDPPTPTQSHINNAVRLRIIYLHEGQWLKLTDTTLRSSIADALTRYCGKNETTRAQCGLRGNAIKFSVHDVNRLPGQPVNEGNYTFISIYAVYPNGTNVPVPQSALLNALNQEINTIQQETRLQLEVATEREESNDPTKDPTAEKDEVGWPLILGITLGLALVLSVGVSVALMARKHTGHKLRGPSLESTAHQPCRDPNTPFTLSGEWYLALDDDGLPIEVQRSSNANGSN